MKMKRSLLRAATAIVACAVIASSCKPETVTVTGVTLDQSTLTLTEGGSANLKATVKPDNAANKAVVWKSDKADVATVDTSGKVTAVKTGSATITVATVDGGKTAICTVKVEAKSTPAPVISITTQPTAPSGLVEGSIPADTRLTVAATVTEGATLKYQWYAWDKAGNKVSQPIEGVTGASYTLPAMLGAGEHWYVCQIGAAGAQPKLTEPVKVVIAPKPDPAMLTVNPSVDLSIPAMTIGTEIDQVDVSKAVAGGKKPYTYSATDIPAGLAISSAGVISGTPTAAFAAGTITVTVTDSSSPAQSKTITIAYGAATTTHRPVTNIKNVPTATIAGIDLVLTGTVVPSNATRKTIVWSVKSDGGTGATIARGTNILKTISGGTVVVTATISKGKTPDTSYKKNFTITVTTPTNEIIFGGENEEEWP